MCLSIWIHFKRRTEVITFRSIADASLNVCDMIIGFIDCCCPFWGADRRSSRQETTCLLWIPKVIGLFTRARNWTPILSQMNSIRVLISCSYNIHLNVILPRTLIFSSNLFLSGLRTKMPGLNVKLLNMIFPIFFLLRTLGALFGA
jgi:hypothetical protein